MKTNKLVESKIRIKQTMSSLSNNNDKRNVFEEKCSIMGKDNTSNVYKSLKSVIINLIKIRSLITNKTHMCVNNLAYLCGIRNAFTSFNSNTNYKY